tara:strand:- start:1597 stop:2433 length:837 start_codon:yes stop_codon:yes gene_type:complete
MPLATAVAIGSLALTATTTAMSFKQASDQNKAMLKAQDEADKAMAEARKKLDVNFYESLSIPKEAYAQQVQANLSAGAQTLQAASEGESRGVGAVAGLVQAQQNQAQNEIRANMGQDIYNLQAATAQEDARLRDIGIQLDLGEVEGAQLAASNAQELSAQALQQGMQGLTSFAGQAAEQVPLFEKSASTRQADKLNQQYGQAQAIKTATQTKLPGVPYTSPSTPPLGTYQQEIAKLGMVGGTDFSGVSKLKPEEFNTFMSKLDPRTLRELNKSNPFIQ